MKSEYKKYYAVMLVCFILGGFSLVVYLLDVYNTVSGRGFFPANRENISIEINGILQNETGNRSHIPLQNPMASPTSPFSIVFLFNGIALLLGGFSIWTLTREKEISSVKERLTSILLLPEERTVIDELRKSKGSITQSQLVKNTGISKVKMHRIVAKLAVKGIIKKYPYGLTNKIVLEKEV